MIGAGVMLPLRKVNNAVNAAGAAHSGNAPVPSETDGPSPGTSTRPETGGQFVLNQNYPNPFRFATTIEFSLAGSSKVWLDLYNIAGVKVARLIDGQLNEGEHSVQWNREVEGAMLPPGNYAFQLNVANETGVHRQSKVMTIN